MITPEAQAGINQSLDNADRKIPAWSEQAYNHLIAFLSYHTNEPFLTEQVRFFAEFKGLPQPPDNRAWGGIIQKAVKRNIIKMKGFAATKNKISHGRPMMTWIKNI